MGKLLDELIRTAKPAPWLSDDPDGDAITRAKRDRKILKAHLSGTAHNLPPPYHRPIGSGVLERDILAAVRQKLLMRRIWHKRIDNSGKIIGGGDSKTIIPGSHTGLPDLIAIQSGQFIGIEVKRPGGRVTALQLQTLKEIQAAGGSACIAVDPDAFCRWLDGEGPTAKLDGVAVL